MSLDESVELDVIEDEDEDYDEGSCPDCGAASDEECDEDCPSQED